MSFCNWNPNGEWPFGPFISVDMTQELGRPDDRWEDEYDFDFVTEVIE